MGSTHQQQRSADGRFSGKDKTDGTPRHDTKRDTKDGGTKRDTKDGETKSDTKGGSKGKPHEKHTSPATGDSGTGSQPKPIVLTAAQEALVAGIRSEPLKNRLKRAYGKGMGLDGCPFRYLDGVCAPKGTKECMFKNHGSTIAKTAPSVGAIRMLTASSSTYAHVPNIFVGVACEVPVLHTLRDNTKELVAFGTAGCHPSGFILDTGAVHSLFPDALLRTIETTTMAQLPPKRLPPPPGMIAKAANGTPVPLLGQVVLSTRIVYAYTAPDGEARIIPIEVPIKYWIVAALDVPILGCDALHDGPLGHIASLELNGTRVFTTNWGVAIPPKADEEGNLVDGGYIRSVTITSASSLALPNGDPVVDDDDDDDDASIEMPALLPAAWPPTAPIRAVRSEAAPAMPTAAPLPPDSPFPNDESNDPATSGRFTLRQIWDTITGPCVGDAASPAQRLDMCLLLYKHARIFGQSAKALPTTVPEHPLVGTYNLRLRSEGVMPPRVNAAPLAPDSEAGIQMKKQLDAYTGAGIVRGPYPPATHPAFARAFMVNNGRGKWRLVTALQDVNRFTELDGPSQRDNLVRDAKQAAHVHLGKRCFSGVDALEGFTVVRNSPLTAELCSLATPWGTYIANRMLFGSTFAPEVFHTALARIIEDAKSFGADTDTAQAVSDNLISVSQFIDDMLQGVDPTDAKAWQMHMRFWDRLLTTLFEAGFRLKLSKCKWLQSVGEFCGYLIDGTAMRADLARYVDLDNLEPPASPSALSRGIGFFNYFAANIPAPIYGPHMRALHEGTKMAKKDYQASLREPAGGPIGRAFAALREAVRTHCTLIMPDPSLPIYIVTDASDYWGHGGVAIQFDRVTGAPKALAYWSKMWTPAQERWSPGRKEAFGQYHAITAAVPRFVMHLPTVILQTDANNLSSVKRVGGNLASEDALVARWAWRMLHYPHFFNYSVRIPGRINFFGDMPSRQREGPRDAADVVARIQRAIDDAAARSPVPVVPPAPRLVDVEPNPGPAGDTAPDAQTPADKASKIARALAKLGDHNTAGAFYSPSAGTPSPPTAVDTPPATRPRRNVTIDTSPPTTSPLVTKSRRGRTSTTSAARPGPTASPAPTPSTALPAGSGPTAAPARGDLPGPAPTTIPMDKSTTANQPASQSPKGTQQDEGTSLPVQSGTTAPPPGGSPPGARRRGRPPKGLDAPTTTTAQGPLSKGIGAGARVVADGEPATPGHLKAAPLVLRIISDQRTFWGTLTAYADKGTAGSVPGFDIARLHGLGDVATYRGRLYVHSTEIRHDTFRLAHDADGHPGRDRLVWRITTLMRLGWPNIDRDAAGWIASCAECQLDKFRLQHDPLRSGVSNPSVPAFPDHTWHMDPCGPFNGWSLFVIVDAFTHYTWVIPLRGADASQCYDILARVALGVGHWPLSLRVDDAKNLNTGTFRTQAASHGCSIVEGPAYSQWTNGMAETRMHQIKMLIRAMGAAGLKPLLDAPSASPDDILRACSRLAELHNHNHNRTLGASPAQVRYGNVRPCNLEIASGAFEYLGRPANWPIETPLYANALAALQATVAVTLTMAKLKDATENDAKRLAPHEYKDGDLVILQRPLSLESTKSNFSGPFRVLGQAAGPSWYNITQLENYADRVYPFSAHVSALKPFNAERTTIEQLLKRRLSDEFGIVKAVTAHKAPTAPGCEAEFLVTWDGCPDAIFTPASWLSRVRIFQDYIKLHNLTPSEFGLTADWKPSHATTAPRELRDTNARRKAPAAKPKPVPAPPLVGIELNPGPVSYTLGQEQYLLTVNARERPYTCTFARPTPCAAGPWKGGKPTHEYCTSDGRTGAHMFRTSARDDRLRAQTINLRATRDPLAELKEAAEIAALTYAECSEAELADQGYYGNAVIVDVSIRNVVTEPTLVTWDRAQCSRANLRATREAAVQYAIYHREPNIAARFTTDAKGNGTVFGSGDESPIYFHYRTRDREIVELLTVERGHRTPGRGDGQWDTDQGITCNAVRLRDGDPVDPLRGRADTGPAAASSSSAAQPSPFTRPVLEGSSVRHHRVGDYSAYPVTAIPRGLYSTDGYGPHEADTAAIALMNGNRAIVFYIDGTSTRGSSGRHFSSNTPLHHLNSWGDQQHGGENAPLHWLPVEHQLTSLPLETITVQVADRPSSRLSDPDPASRSMDAYMAVDQLYRVTFTGDRNDYEGWGPHEQPSPAWTSAAAILLAPGMKQYELGYWEHCSIDGALAPREKARTHSHIGEHPNMLGITEPIPVSHGRFVILPIRDILRLRPPPLSPPWTMDMLPELRSLSFQLDIPMSWPDGNRIPALYNPEAAGYISILSSPHEQRRTRAAAFIGNRQRQGFRIGDTGEPYDHNSWEQYNRLPFPTWSILGQPARLRPPYNSDRYLEAIERVVGIGPYAFNNGPVTDLDDALTDLRTAFDRAHPRRQPMIITEGGNGADATGIDMTPAYVAKWVTRAQNTNHFAPLRSAPASPQTASAGSAMDAHERQRQRNMLWAEPAQRPRSPQPRASNTSDSAPPPAQGGWGSGGARPRPHLPASSQSNLSSSGAGAGASSSSSSSHAAAAPPPTTEHTRVPSVPGAPTAEDDSERDRVPRALEGTNNEDDHDNDNDDDDDVNEDDDDNNGDDAQTSASGHKRRRTGSPGDSTSQ